MSLAALSGEQDRRWSAALASNYANVGTDPYAIWTTALAEVGSDVSGPDDAGEYSSNCPNPGHNGGSGDTKASLRWRQTADGQILFHCHAGCDGEDITTTLGVTFVQLRWGRTEYYYRSDLRVLIATHVKVPTAGGKKRYWWEHEENGTSVNGRGSEWEAVLWGLPDLQLHAERARADGTKIHLWLAEGEKDCVTVTDALEAGWTPPGEHSDDGWLHLVTTSADGAAASWTRDLTKQVLGLGAEVTTILCDSDEAGSRRGTAVTEALLEEDPSLRVAVISWVGREDCKDASDAIARFAAGWLREAVAAGDADPYLWCSVDTGWFYEADAADVDGTLTGRRALHRMTGVGTKGARPEAITKWPVRVIASTVNTEGDPVGWELDLGPGGTRPLRSDDLVGSAFESWNARYGLFVVPTRSLAAPFRAYLGHHGVNTPTMAVWEHEGWVDNETFVTGSEILIGKPGMIGRAEAGVTEWHYGHADGDEAARIAADILTFRPLGESAPVLSWLAATSVKPRALEASGASFVPMLQVPGDSGTGKTSFLKLATRLFGYAGSPVSNVTTAGLIRILALSTQTVWIDDFANYDDTVRDIIRGGLTGAGRTRGTTQSERGIVRDEARAALVNSGETAMGLEERAMRQRSVVVPFTERAQGRESRRPDSSGRGQYADMVEYGVDRDDHGGGLSRWAGSVVRGLHEAAVRAASGQASHEAVREAAAAASRDDGVREAAAWRFVEYGSAVLGEWMLGAGIPPARVVKLIGIVRGTVRKEVASALRREKSGADIHLVTTLVPAYLRFRRQMMDTAISGRLYENEGLNPTTVSRVVRDSWRTADVHRLNNHETDGRPARGAVLVVGPSPDGDDELGESVLAIALCSASLAEWAISEEGRRTGIGNDRRFVTKEGLGMQVAAISEKTDEWRGGGSPIPGKIRIKLSAGQSPLYSVVTDPEVIGAILGS